MFDYTAFLVGIWFGIVIYFLASAGAKWFRMNKTRERIRHLAEIEEKDGKRIEKELNDYIDNTLAWMLTSGFPREKLYNLLETEIWGEDRENLQFAMDFVAHHLKSREFTELITLKRYDSEWKSLYIAILPSAVPDTDRRRRLSSSIEDELTKYIHESYGDFGEMCLNVTFHFTVIDDQLNEVAVRQE